MMLTRDNKCCAMRHRQRTLVRLVLASTIAAYAQGDFSGILEAEFQNAEEIQAAFIQQHGLKNRTCNEYYSFDGGDAGVVASQFLDGFIEVMGTDTIRPMSMGNMRNVVVRKHLDHAARLVNQVPSSRLTDRKAALIQQGKLETCAIIGNSGHLKATSYGANIDRFDLVARGNQAPIKGYEEYVGSKTTMRFLNEAMTYRYKNSIVWAMRDSFQSCLQDYYNRAMRGVRRFGGSRQRFQGQRQLTRRRKLLQQEKQFGGHTGGDMDTSTRLSISSRLSQALRDRKVPLSAAAWARLAAQQARHQQQEQHQQHQQQQEPLQMENASPARPIRVPMPPFMLQKAQSSCKPVLHKYAMQLGKITDDTVQFEDWAFPLEQGAVLTHISEFKLTPAYHRLMSAHFRTLRRDVKSAMVNYPVSFLAEDIIKKWTDYLVCKGDLPEAGGTRPTTGFSMLLSLLPMCDKVVMYGFGPPSGNPPNGTDYHFFQSMLSRSWKTTSSNVHNFRAEYLFIKSLARKGRLTICNNANSPECGLNDENLDAAEAAAAAGT